MALPSPKQLLLWSLAAVAACGTLFTDAPDDELVLAGPVEGLSGPQLGQHAQGDAEFGRTFGMPDGLGPIFIAASCESCHPGDGKGHPVFALTRFGRGSADGFDPMRELGGPQLQHRAIPRYLAEVVPGHATGVARFLAPALAAAALPLAASGAAVSAADLRPLYLRAADIRPSRR